MTQRPQQELLPRVVVHGYDAPLEDLSTWRGGAETNPSSLPLRWPAWLIKMDRAWDE